MRYCRAAPFLSHGSSREIIPPCHAPLGWGCRRVPTLVMLGQVSSTWGPLWTRIQETCIFSALGTQQRKGPLLFLLILSDSVNRWSSRFWNELPQTPSAMAWACIGGLGITRAFQSVPRASCHDFTWASLVELACLLWIGFDLQLGWFSLMLHPSS